MFEGGQESCALPDDPPDLGGAGEGDLGDARVLKARFEALLELQILVKQVRVVSGREPAAAPRLVVTESQADRVNFLTHGERYSFSARWIYNIMMLYLYPGVFIGN